MERRRFVVAVTAGAAACSGGAAASESRRVYMSTLPSGLPSFSNAPAHASDRLVMHWPDPPPRPLSAFDPMPPRQVRPTLLLSQQQQQQQQQQQPPSRSPWRNLWRSSFDAVIRAAAVAYRVEDALIRAVIEVESGFNPRARSPVGATGLMQLMPATARRYGVRDANDPVQNIDGGTRYLRDLLDLFGGDQRLALAGYNAGEGAVLRHGRRIPPYAETQAYVPKVLLHYQRHRLAAAGRTAVP